MALKKRGKGVFADFLNSVGGLNLLLLSLVSLLNDISSEMIQPLLPLLISAIGGTGLAVGLIGGLMDGLPNIIKVIVGYFSDKIRKRKRFIFGGYFLTQASKIGIALSNFIPGIIFFTSLDKVGKGIREPPRDALISQSLPRERGKAFGIQRAFDRGGAIIGSLFALILVIFLSPYFKQLDLIKWIILAAAIIGFTALIPIFFVKEPKKRKRNGKMMFFSSMSKLSKPLVIFTFASCIFALANFSYLFFILKASKLFAGDGQYLLPVIPILLYVFFNVAYSAFSVPFGKLSDYVGRKRVLIMGYCLFALVCLGFVFFTSLPAYIILFVLYGLSSAMVYSNQNAFASDLSSEGLRATALGAFQTAIGVVAIISGLAAGYLFDINSSFTFIYGFVMSIIALLIFLIFSKQMKK